MPFQITPFPGQIGISCVLKRSSQPKSVPVFHLPLD